MKKRYINPTVEIVEVAVEHGIAASVIPPEAGGKVVIDKLGEDFQI